jgi:hypothetical protein
MRTPTQKLTRDEAFREIDALVVELDAGWQRDGLDWAPELLSLLRDFRAASEFERLTALRTQLREFFLRERKKVKGISFVLIWADFVVESYERPVA